MTADRKQIARFVFGLALGGIVGAAVTIGFLAPGKTETFQEYRERTLAESRARTTTNTPDAGAGHGGDPHGGAAGDPHGGGAMDPHGGSMSPEDRLKRQAATVHFMKKFVSALRELPENRFPATGYESLLKEPEKPFGCAQCHDPDALDLDKMQAMDPGADAVEPFRQNRAFMIGLMQKWVRRLNDAHGDKLVKPVTCTSCHAVDPSNFDEQLRVFPPLMESFVRSLRERPKNANPAPDWKPLLKDPESKAPMCVTCHGRVGEQMEANLDRFPKERPNDYADNKEFMIRLMEDWVAKLNRHARHLTTKAIVCRDCHSVDPRR